MSLDALKSLDLEKLQASWRSLDPENIGGWPLPFRVLIWVLIVVVIFFGGYMLLVSAKLDQLKGAQQAEVSKKADFESKAFKASNLDVYHKQLSEMEDSFGALLRQLPKETEVPGLLEDINQTGLGSGLDFEAINLLPEQVKDFYAEDPIDIKVKGDYHAFGSFVSGIAALPRIVTLHDFKVTPVGVRAAGDNAPPLLEMDITAKTYRYLDKQTDKTAGGKQK
ncbi:MAG: type 4a pilus biogenesis protein PilO [Pseudomonadales bacterium]|nr:type 4a pilus biogenesis protein PilO [Pseudomonadales bacterium]